MKVNTDFRGPKVVFANRINNCCPSYVIKASHLAS